MFTRHIPNIITLCNLAIGVLAVFMALENQVLFASWLVLLAALLDFLDGFLARILNAISPLGKQLDSFADLISFGLAPSAITYKLMEFSIRGDIFLGGIQDFSLPERLFLFSPILLVLFATMRLAEFNLGEESSSFTGFPTPATAIFIAGGNMALVQNMNHAATDFFLQPVVLLLMIVFFSLLMISRIPMFSLKFRDFRWTGNQIRYIFLAVSCILLIILQEIALPVIILLYLLLSISLTLIRNNRK
ncbi:CDP-alcohol phosphatidyltransferase family protein [Bacteroidota bacterium]